MRWATLIAPFRFTRNQNHHLHQSQSSHLCFYSSSSSLIAHELSLTNQILSLLHSLPSSPSSSSPLSLESSLDVLSPFLTPHVISAVLSHSPPFPAAFRLFVWSSSRRRLRSFHSLNLIVSSLLSDPLLNFPSSWHSLSLLHASRRPIPPLPFVALISAHSASGHTESALDAFARMSEFGCVPDVFLFNTVLHLLVRKDPIFLAMVLALYYRMLKLSCRPNRATFVILITGLCKAGLVDDAHHLLDEMVKSGITPNTVIYTPILSCLCSQGKMDEARGLLESMRRNGVWPDSIAYGAVLSGYCKLGRIGEAFECLRVFQEEGFVLGVSGYSCLIDSLFRANRFDDACRVYEEMPERNVQPDCVLYTILMRGYMEAGRVDEAIGLLKEMTERGVVPDTYCYNTLIKGLCDAGCLDQARSLRVEISKNNLFPDSTTETIVICGLCKEGLVGEAQQIFKEMGKHGCDPTVHTFNSLISGLCKVGKLEEAESLVLTMEMKSKPSLFLRLSQGGNRLDDGHLHKLVEQYCEAGNVVQAYKLLRDVIGVVPDVITYNALIDGLFRAAKPDKALKYYNRLQIMGHHPDEVTRGTVIDGLVKVHKEETALTVSQYMWGDGCPLSPKNCNTLMKILCQTKKISKAVSLWLIYIARLRTSPEDVETIKMLKNHFEEGRIEETIKGLIEMDRKVGSVNSSPYTIWLIGFCQARQVDEALKIFTILRESDVEATPASCVRLIYSLCWEGKLASALDVMLYALSKGFSVNKHAGNRLLKNLCMGNRKKEAHELVWRMSLAGYDMDMYLRAATKQLLYSRITGVG